MIEDIKDLIKETFYVIGMLFWVCFVFFIVVAIGWGIFMLFINATKTPEQREEMRKAEIAERTPHVYSKVDGCTVYIWNNGGHNHYFTKCDNTNKVVTESNHTESCGKACSKTVTEKIETN